MDNTTCLDTRPPGLAMSHNEPVRAVIHSYDGKPEWATLFLGGDADAQFHRFVAELETQWPWDWETPHRPVAGPDDLPLDFLLDGVNTVFVLAQAYGPPLVATLDAARRSGTLAVVFTRDAAAFPADLGPVLEMAPQLDFWESLRAVVGGVTNRGMPCMDFLEVHTVLAQSHRLVQRVGTTGPEEYPFRAANRAMAAFVDTPSPPSQAGYGLISLQASPDSSLKSLLETVDELFSGLHPDCFSPYKFNLEWPSAEAVRVVVTLGWARSLLDAQGAENPAD